MATVNNTATGNFDFGKLDGSSSTAASGATAGNSAAAIQDRFLTLLTTQLKAQDPLNPMNNDQITSQMAQISTVTGLEKMNAAIQSMTEGQLNSQSLLATMLIGRQGLVPGNGITLDAAGKASAAAVKLDANADRVTVTVTDKNGTVVDVTEMGAQKAGQLTIEWDGKDRQGNQLPAGSYNFVVDAYSQGKAVQNSSLAAMKIASVAWEKGAAILVMENGKRVPVNQLTQIV